MNTRNDGMNNWNDGRNNWNDDNNNRSNGKNNRNDDMSNCNHDNNKRGSRIIRVVSAVIEYYKNSKHNEYDNDNENN